MSEAGRRLAVVLTSGVNGDRSSVAFTIANASLSAGMQVMVWLASDGVDLCREGAADQCHVPPFLPLAELMEKFLGAGGAIVACGSCFQYRGLKPEQAAAGVRVAGVGALVEWMAAGAASVSI